MPRFNVSLPDGRWQVFSTIVDDFVSEPLTFDELKDFRLKSYGATYEETETLLTDNPQCNRMTYEEAMDYMRSMEDDTVKA